MCCSCLHVDHWNVGADLPHDFAHVWHKREGIAGRAHLEGTASRAWNIYSGLDGPPEAIVFHVANYAYNLPAGAGCPIWIFTGVRSVIAERPLQRVAFRKVRAK
jgi:hypothetical protein